MRRLLGTRTVPCPSVLGLAGSGPDRRKVNPKVQEIVVGRYVWG
jgi:hypothetical protein